MRKTSIRYRLIHLLFLGGSIAGMGLSSCNNTRYLPANESLYTGASVDFQAPELRRKTRKAIRAELEELTRPRPNSSVLGLRPKLWFWNISREPKRKISLNRLLRKIGEEPRVLSDLNLQKNIDILQNRLENSGFFHAEVTGRVQVKNRRASAEYTARAGPRYRFRNIHFPEDSMGLAGAVGRVRRGSLLKPGAPFDLDLIKTERVRIDDRLKQRGYYFFDADRLIVDVDSAVGDQQVDAWVRIKPQTPEAARRPYRIGEVVIYPTWRLDAAESDTSRKYAVQHRSYVVIDSARFFKPKLFEQAMQFEPGDLYRRVEHNATLSRLINLGIFKFVRNDFVPAGDSLLDVRYYLTPHTRKSLRIELGGNTKSNNLTGSEITVGFTNRNSFRGGEILTVNASAGSEVQVSGQFRGFNTYRLNGEAALSIPRFVIPFVQLAPRGGFLPRTHARLGYELLNRRKLYTLHSFRGAFGYVWKENAFKEHTLYPVSVQYVQPIRVTPLYLQSIAEDESLRKVIDTQFILGANYNFLFNRLTGRSDNGFYFNGLFDVSGNIAGLIRRNIIKSGDTARLFGAPFSQFLKLETDFRYYRKLGGEQVWANRLILGMGIPYGNSRELPFVKQFFSGGNNSVRAFRSRSLGPGTYRAEDTTGRGFFPDQSGDLKLEFSTEYRFPIVKPVFGAIFLDAGNIWLYNENPVRPGAKFSDRFLRELGLGGGAGVRVDISFLVLRLDVAFPLRKPWLPDGGRWVLDAISFGNKNWRQENLIFNLAIGYPF